MKREPTSGAGMVELLIEPLIYAAGACLLAAPLRTIAFLITAIAVVVLLYAAFRWRAFRARKRERLGQCVACGYDLRATPRGCPECGMSAVAVASGEART